MKTLLICWEQRKRQHLGEYYDEILWIKSDFINNNYVNSLSDEECVTTDSYIPRIKDAIRLANSHHEKNEINKVVEIHIDCFPVFKLICENLQIEMKEKEKIEIRIF